MIISASAAEVDPVPKWESWLFRMKPEQPLRANQLHGTSLLSTATWHCWLLTGFYLYSVNLQCNVVPFLQAEFALSYRAVSLHSSAIAVGLFRCQESGIRYQASDGARRA